MAGIFPDSSSIRPWIQADVFVFSEGVPEDPSQVQTLGTPLPSPSVLSEASLLLPRRSLSRVAQVGPWDEKTPWSWWLEREDPRFPTPSSYN